MTDNADTAPSPIPDHPDVAKLRTYLSRKCRITASDGRVFVGHFMCIDKGRNIILSGTEESNKFGEKRFLGLVMIPGKHLVKAEMEVTEKKAQADPEEDLYT
ncbi:hypothetical protein HDV00_004211 [Rhizophlyctis rosea]|nr:hypothetical protein HDV00_004211 [Rhizophlyctis rosea]